MTSSQAATEAGAVPAARVAPDGRPRHAARYAVPAGRHARRAPGPGGHQLRGRLLRRRRSVTLCLFDAAGAETQVPLRGLRRWRVAWLRARRRPGPGLRLPGRRALGPGPGPALQPGQAAARPVRPGGARRRYASGRRCSATTRPTPTSRAPWTPPGTCRAAWSSTPAFELERRRPAPPPVRGHGHLRGARQGLHHAPPGRARRTLRGTYAGLAPPRPPSGTCVDLGVTAVELLPVHQNVPEAVPGRAGPDQLLGLQHDRLSSPRTTATPRSGPGDAGGQVAEFKADGRRAARGRARGDPRRGVQPHRRGQRVGPDAVLPRARQPGLLPPGHGDPRAYYDTPAAATR